MSSEWISKLILEVNDFKPFDSNLDSDSSIFMLFVNCVSFRVVVRKNIAQLFKHVLAFKVWAQKKEEMENSLKYSALTEWEKCCQNKKRSESKWIFNSSKEFFYLFMRLTLIRWLIYCRLLQTMKKVRVLRKFTYLKQNFVFFIIPFKKKTHSDELIEHISET